MIQNDTKCTCPTFVNLCLLYKIKAFPQKRNWIHFVTNCLGFLFLALMFPNHPSFTRKSFADSSPDSISMSSVDFFGPDWLGNRSGSVTTGLLDLALDLAFARSVGAASLLVSQSTPRDPCSLRGNVETFSGDSNAGAFCCGAFSSGAFFIFSIFSIFPFAIFATSGLWRLFNHSMASSSNSSKMPQLLKICCQTGSFEASSHKSCNSWGVRKGKNKYI